MLSKLKLYKIPNRLFLSIENNSIGIGDVCNNQYFFYWKNIIIGFMWYDMPHIIYHNIRSLINVK